MSRGKPAVAMLAAATLSIFSSDGVAQKRTASNDTSFPAKVAEVAFLRYTDCIISRRHLQNNVKIYLRTLPRSVYLPVINAKLPVNIQDSSCLNKATDQSKDIGTVADGFVLQMKFTEDGFRGKLYNSLYRRDFGSYGVPAGIAAIKANALETEFDGDLAQLAPSYRSYRALSDCVVRASPEGVHRLMMATPFSESERQSFDALRSALGGCLSEGRSVELKRITLRGYLAESLYKLASAAKAAPTAFGTVS